MTSAEIVEHVGVCRPNLVIDSIELLGEGDFCAAFLVNESWVFRFAKHDQAAAALRIEGRLLPRIAHQFDIPVPSPQSVQTERKPIFMVYPMLAGPALSRRNYLRLAESDRQRCAGQVGAFLRQMHATPLKLADECGVEVTDYVLRHNRLLDQARACLFPKLAPAERFFVEKKVAEYMDSEDSFRFDPALLHGDLSPGHVLVDECGGAITGIIDFGDVSVGDPAGDLVNVYEDFGLDFLARMLHAYAPNDLSALLTRLYRYYVLWAIEWAVDGVEKRSAPLGDVLIQMNKLRVEEQARIHELFRSCDSI